MNKLLLKYLWSTIDVISNYKYKFMRTHSGIYIANTSFVFTDVVQNDNTPQVVPNTMLLFIIEV